MAMFFHAADWRSGWLAGWAALIVLGWQLKASPETPSPQPSPPQSRERGSLAENGQEEAIGGARSLRTVDGGRYRGRLVGWPDARTLRFEVGQATPVDVPLDQIVRFGAGESGRARQGLLLVDGTFLAGRVRRWSTESCEVAGELISSRVPIEWVRAVLLNAPASGGLRDEAIAEAHTARGDRDRLWLIDGQRLAGVLRAAADSPRGGRRSRTAEETTGSERLVWDGDPTTAISLEVGGQPAEIPAARVRSVTLSPLLRAPATAAQGSFVVGLTDGSRVVVGQVEEVTAYRIQWRTAAGLSLSMDSRGGGLATDSATGPAARASRALLWEQLTLIAPLDGPPQRLDGDRVLRFRHQPRFGLAWEAVLDAGEGLRVGERWFEHSMAMPPQSQAVLRVPQGATALSADLLVGDWGDGRAEGVRGSLEFAVMGVDDAGGVTPLWRSAARGVDGDPLPVDVPLGAARLVVLAVDAADRGGVGVVGHWIDPIFVVR